jgi:hypothetical protein
MTSKLFYMLLQQTGALKNKEHKFNQAGDKTMRLIQVLISASLRIRRLAASVSQRRKMLP